jgi:NAD(P)-dependent dehydrogenase (short-subunit alcohol dehydrogenase family)
MLTVEWSRILKPDNVKVFAISPGFLATNLAGATPEQLRSMGAQEPSFGAEFVRDVVEGKRDADAGKVLRKTGIQPW